MTDIDKLRAELREWVKREDGWKLIGQTDLRALLDHIDRLESDGRESERLANKFAAEAALAEAELARLPAPAPISRRTRPMPISDEAVEAAAEAWVEATSGKPPGTVSIGTAIRAALTAADAVRSRTLLAREPGAFPQLPDDDADFTPDLARKIIRIYQSMIAAGDTSHD